MASSGFLGRFRLLATRDLDAARAAIDPLWERHRCEPVDGSPFHLDLRQVAFGQTQLMYIDATARVRVRCEPVTGFHLVIHEAGGCVYRSGARGETVASPEQAVLQAAGQSLDITTEPYRALVLSLDPLLVRQALPEAARRHPGAPPSWPTQIAMAAPEMACLASFCRWLAAEIDRSEGGMLTMPRALGNVERTLMSLFASAVGGSLPEPGSAAGLSAAALRRIDAWMDAHHAEGIGVEDMARFAGVSVRSLQAAFRRTYGITPSAALLACRLRHARARLSRPLPNTSVTQVALDCGFFHLGRFARQYRQMFGESPSATLRRAT